MSQPLILHYHIFKNAGTSFNWSLQQNFGDRFLEFDLPKAHQVISAAEISQFVIAHPEALALSSHQALLPVPEVPEREIFSTLLIRDPIARIRSVYAFERRQNAQSPGALKAKELDFKAYVEWRLTETPTVLCNFQVHFCSRSNETKGGIPQEEQFQRAVSHLENVSVVGTVERYVEWLQLAEMIMRPSFPDLTLQATQKNVTGTSSSSCKENLIDELTAELGDAVVDHLLAANQLDMRLHQVADALLSKNLAVGNVSNKLGDCYRTK